MFEAEYDDFVSELTDLCLSVNRPCGDDLVRVFWEDLKGVPLPTIKRRAAALRQAGKTRFTSYDLRPEPEPEKARSTFEPFTGEGSDDFQRIAGVALLRFLYRNDVPADLLPQLRDQQKTIITAGRETTEWRGLKYEQLRAEMEPMLMKAFDKILRTVISTEAAA